VVTRSITTASTITQAGIHWTLLCCTTPPRWRQSACTASRRTRRRAHATRTPGCGGGRAGGVEPDAACTASPPMPSTRTMAGVCGTCRRTCSPRRAEPPDPAGCFWTN
jgi:hypothetical protein